MIPWFYKPLIITSTLTIILLTVSLMGCGPVRPVVIYETIQPIYNIDNSTINHEAIAKNLEGKKIFSLASRSLILLLPLNEKETSNITGAGTFKIKALIVADENPTQAFRILEKRNYLVETNLNITYVDNQRTVKKVGVKVEDNRIKRIQEIGGVVTAVVPLLLAVEAPKEEEGLQLPIALDGTKGSEGELPNNPRWKYKIEVGKPPLNAIRFEDFQKEVVQKHKEISIFPYPACVDITLTLTKDKMEGGRKVAVQVLVAKLRGPSSEYLEVAELPVQGSLTSHTACGMDVVADTADVPSNAEVLGELIKQAKSIKETWEKAKDEKQKQ